MKLLNTLAFAVAALFAATFATAAPAKADNVGVYVGSNGFGVHVSNHDGYYGNYYNRCRDRWYRKHHRHCWNYGNRGHGYYYGSYPYRQNYYYGPTPHRGHHWGHNRNRNHGWNDGRRGRGGWDRHRDGRRDGQRDRRHRGGY